MIEKIRTSRFCKFLAAFISLNLVVETLLPTLAYGLTGGPSQPEVQSFEPIGTTQMVNPFSGDFTYNVPLLDVGGYPVNLSYHSGVGMDQEASWVGLGWNINPGVINRNMRGLPDDFKGDVVKMTNNMKDNMTLKLVASVDLADLIEVFGFSPKKFVKKLDMGFKLGLLYNNYKGVGYEIGTDFTKGPLNLELGFNSQSGIDVNPSITFSKDATVEKNENTFIMKSGATSVSTGFNSRSGLKALSIRSEYSKASTTVTESADGEEVEDDDMDTKIKSSNGSAQISFANSSYMPTLNPNSFSNHYSATVKPGPKFVGVFPNAKITGFFSIEGYRDKTVTKNAYGYFHSEKAPGSALTDVNRENDGPFNKFTKYLNQSNHTYDVLSASGQGTGATFRPFRNQLGSVRDPYVVNNNFPSIDLSGIEIGAGNTIKWGGDLKLHVSMAHSGRWNNPEFSKLFFKDKRNADVLDEPYYIKNMGEKVVNDGDYYDKLKNTDAIRLGLKLKYLDEVSKNVKDAVKQKLYEEGLTNTDPDPSIEKFVLNESIRREKRAKRNQVVSTLTAKEAKEVALEKKIRNYIRNIDGSPEYLSNNLNYNELNRETSTLRKPHHISEVTSINPDGTRYIYGIPAYNTKQIEKTFSVGQNNNGSDLYNCNTQGVISSSSYTNTDASSSNSRGIDHYFNQRELPGYAHSYLLTAVLSADYVDLTGDGPTEDDLGGYTKLNYSKEQNKHKWRTPYAGANLNRGQLSTLQDDKASIVYGEKEVWYLHTIETKSHIAEFHLSSRRDAMEANNLNQGNQGSSKVKKLDKIVLFSKVDRLKNGVNATPIKTVHFEYSYDLCPDVKNFEQMSLVNPPAHSLYNYDNSYNWNEEDKRGKLTLHKVYFTYGKSNMGRSNPYVFEYKGPNPSYHLKSYDRWGNYKQNDCLLPNEEFPYVKQDKTVADINASAWCLTDIRMPSGGKIQVTYESDDYAYVQDQKAMQMELISGFSEELTTGTLSSNLYSKGDEHNYLYFNIKEGHSVNDYIPNLKKQLYFNCYINLNGKNGSKSVKEFVSGFASIESIGEQDINNNGFVDRGWIKLKTVSIGDRSSGKQVNPIAKQAWQYIRLQTPWLAYPGSDFMNSSQNLASKSASMLFGFLSDVTKMVQGFNSSLRTRKNGKEVVLSKSWVRLNSPTGYKFGGGSRVKMVTMDDNWNSMSGGEKNHKYGQKYDYTTSEEGKTISSGVAAYEPMIGGDENPLRQPVWRKENNKLQPDNNSYNLMPMGESFYPGASVGYSKVTIRELKPSDLGINDKTINKHHTGYTVKTFYTAKDFPVLSKVTTLDKNIYKPFVFSLVGYNKSHATASQGFVIEKNDMHGKPKSVEVYSEGGEEIISSTEYFYKVDNEKSVKKHLNNNIKVLSKDGLVKDGLCGLEIEMVADPREKEEFSKSYSTEVNTDGFLLGIIPGWLPLIMPFKDASHNRVRTVTLTKVVNRFGIMDRVKVTKDGASIETKNLAWDEETGEVLLTQTQNEYGDDFYTMTQPGHWAYEGLGNAYKNIGAEVSVTITAGVGTSTLSGHPFVEGDELVAINTNPAYTGRVWVYKVNGSNVSFMDRVGNLIPNGSYKFKIIRSGRRNMQKLPLSKVTMHNQSPLIKVGSDDIFEGYTSYTNNVLSASSIEYSDVRRQYPNRKMDEIIDRCENYDQIRMLSEEIEMLLMQLEDPNLEESQRTNLETQLQNKMNERLIAINFGAVLMSGGTCTPTNMYKVDDKVNPYVAGFKGNWYSLKSYSFYNKQNPERSVSTDVNSNQNYNFTNTRNDGMYKSYSPLWHSNSGGNWIMDVDADGNEGPTVDNTNINHKWSWTMFNDISNPHGVGLQSKDALNNYSSVLYGYKKNLAIALASNTEHHQFIYDGFEDYWGDLYLYDCDPSMPFWTEAYWDYCNTPRQWYVWPNFTSHVAKVSSKEAHTGNQSLELIHGPIDINLKGLQNETLNNSFTQYFVKKDDLVDYFKPDEGKYLLSYWVKEKMTEHEVQIEYKLQGNTNFTSITLNSFGKDNNVEGWKKKELTFNIPAGPIEEINVKIVRLNGAGGPQGIDSHSVFIDDIRISPYKSNMKSYVYDQVSWKLMAQLDENNYATLYEYSDQGSLIRIKKETEKGIVTIQESRQNLNNINH